MFEKAVIARNTEISGSLDVGLIAETAFYYAEVRLILDRGSISGLAKKISAANLKNLLQRPEVRPTYTRKTFAVMTQPPFGEVDFGELQTVGFENNHFRKLEDEIADIFRHTDYEVADQKMLVKAAMDTMQLHNFSRSMQGNGSISASSRDDALDQRYLSSAAKIILDDLAPGYFKEGYHHFSCVKFGDVLLPNTNIDFGRVQEIFATTPNYVDGQITPSLLLAFIQDANASRYFSAIYGGDLVTTETLSKLVRTKHRLHLVGADQRRNESELFFEAVLPEVPTIRDYINANLSDSTLKEFFVVLDKSAKFKNWLSGIGADGQLLREYVSATTETTFFEKLPGKVLRFVGATALGSATGFALSPAIAPVAALGLGILDTFVLDSFYKGWKPNQFVQGPLASFLAR